MFTFCPYFGLDILSWFINKHIVVKTATEKKLE